LVILTTGDQNFSNEATKNLVNLSVNFVVIRCEEDELVLVSGHGLQDGLHTDEAMIASTDPLITEAFLSVLDVRLAVENKLDNQNHTSQPRQSISDIGDSAKVKKQLDDIDYCNK
jgi:hypothetical protein